MSQTFPSLRSSETQSKNDRLSTLPRMPTFAQSKCHNKHKHCKPPTQIRTKKKKLSLPIGSIGFHWETLFLVSAHRWEKTEASQIIYGDKCMIAMSSFMSSDFLLFLFFRFSWSTCMKHAAVLCSSGKYSMKRNSYLSWQFRSCTAQSHVWAALFLATDSTAVQML